MCDSITFLVLVDDQSQEEYDRCHYPTRGKEDMDESSSDFRDQYATSPLTGAGFKVTAVGQKLSSKGDVGSIEKNRKNYGRVAGYVVNLNPPTCTVGHNRMLVNGVPRAVSVGMALLKHWLASNGCTRKGLNAVKLDNVTIISVTPTYLFPFLDEAAARLVLAHYRARSEALCNTKTKDSNAKLHAFSWPPKQDPHAETYIYSSYIKLREYFFDCYVKVPEVSSAFKVADGCPDFVLDSLARRTLRIGVKLHAKWLSDHGLDKVADWSEREEPYMRAFALVREVLQLNKVFRAKQLRAPTVAKLNLSSTDKMLLRYHLAGNNVREHAIFVKMTGTKASKAYSASRIRVLAATGIAFQVDYAEQVKVFAPPLGEQLAYPGEYVPSDENAPFVYSRTSVPIALAKLAELIEEALTVKEADRNNGKAHGKPPQPQRPTTASFEGSQPRRLRYARGISRVPVDQSAY